MLKLLKVAITGGVASGKSTVCQHLKKLGAYVVSADAIVHELLNPQTDLGQKIIKVVGSDIVQNGKIARSVVAKRVFEDPKLLREVEKILHPAVLKEIERLYAKILREGKSTLFVVEMPLLYEIKAQEFYDVVIAVSAEETKAKQRWVDSGHHPKEYEMRMNRQIPAKIKSAKANYTIYNNSTLEDLYAQVEGLYQSELHRP